MSRYHRPRPNRWDTDLKGRPFEQRKWSRAYARRGRTPFKESKRGKARSRARQNPFNATRPAEWNTMSKSLRKAWNRRHWRAEQWKVDLALKKEATRLAHRKEKGARWSELAAGAFETAVDVVRGNPRRSNPFDHWSSKSPWQRNPGRSTRRGARGRRRNPVLMNPRRRTRRSRR